MAAMLANPDGIEILRKYYLVHPGTRNFITLPGDTIDTVLLASSIVSSQNAAVPLPLADMATPWEWPQCANRSTPQELPKPGACKEVSSRCAAAQGFDRPPDTAPQSAPPPPNPRRNQPSSVCAKSPQRQVADRPRVEELRARPRLTGASREQRYTRYTSRPDW